MPSFLDVPNSMLKHYNVEDINAFNKYTAYYTILEARRFPIWQTFDKLYGTKPWTPNMGTTMKGVRAEPTPVIRQHAYPNPIQSESYTDYFQTKEVWEDAILKKHRFASQQIHYLPSFQDFRENQLAFNRDDISRQIRVYNDIYLRTIALQKARFVGYLGPQGLTIEPAAYIQPGTDITTTTVAAGGKNTAFFQAAAQKVSKNISLRALSNAVATFRDTIGAPFFEGMASGPKDNEIIKGKYVYLGDVNSFENLRWDADFTRFRNMNMDYTTESFNGSIFNTLVYKCQRWPERFTDDGVFPDPEIVTPEGMTVPNPNYINAPNIISYVLAADLMASIKVGPPPKEFAQKQISMQKLRAMQWNGQVLMTDDVLIKDGDGNYDTNKFGEYMQLVSQLVLGGIIKNGRYCLPIIHKASIVQPN